MQNIIVNTSLLNDLNNNIEGILTISNGTLIGTETVNLTLTDIDCPIDGLPCFDFYFVEECSVETGDGISSDSSDSDDSAVVEENDEFCIYYLLFIYYLLYKF